MNILLLSPIAPDAIEALRELHDVVVGYGDHDPALDTIDDREVIIFRSGVVLSAEMMEAMPKLSLIIRAGSGFDNIDLSFASNHGIRVARIPGPSADAVAEFALGLMLALARHVVLADTHMRSGSWPKHQLSGSLLRGKTLGIVGTGSIGGRVGELGAACAMRVLGCVAHPGAYDPEALARRGIVLTDFNTVVAEADYLSVNCPLDETTRGMIDAGVLAAMKPGALLINTARGGIVDEAAVHEALVSGRLAGAALDVHEAEGEGVLSPLAELPNVVLTPHIAGMTLETQRAIGRRVVDLIAAHAAGQLDETATADELLF